METAILAFITFIFTVGQEAVVGIGQTLIDGVTNSMFTQTAEVIDGLSVVGYLTAGAIGLSVAWGLWGKGFRLMKFRR